VARRAKVNFLRAFGALDFYLPTMTIWILALLLLFGFAMAGYQQGAIRTSIAFLGIFVALLFAELVGKLFKPLLGLFGVVNPITLWALPPVLGFTAVMVIIGIAAYMVHQKVDVYYKYRAGDLRLSLWERLNSRLGACVGVLNGVAYLVLLSFVIHAFSYWTVQMASSSGDPMTKRLLNQMGRDLQATGMDRVGKAVDPLSDSFYDMADLAGLMYHNPLLEARLLRYPGLLSLGERTEFQELGRDESFAALRLQATPLHEVLEQPSAKAIFANPDLQRQIWDTLQPDLKDLQAFLETGKSAKYDGERLLGRWRFDPNGTILAFRRGKPNAPGSEISRMRAWFSERFANSSIVAAPDKMVVLKSFPQATSPDLQTLKGTWSADGYDYLFSLEGGTDARIAKFEGNHLVITTDSIALAFAKED
jgi:hypothetical protein